MMLRVVAGIGATLVVAAVAGIGCKKAEAGFGAPPPCPAGQKCQTGVVGGGSGGGGGSGAGGNGAGGGVSGSLTGDVGIMTTETFDQVTAFNGKITVIGNKSGGGQVKADYMGSATGFDLEGLANGEQWIFAEDATMGGAGILATYSSQKVPGVAVTLPVIDTQMMTKIISTLPIASTLNPSAAQIILILERNGKPFTGVSVQGSGPGGVIAYDTGLGKYSNQTTATGSAGVVLILNTPAGVQGKVTVTLVDPMSNTYPLGQIPVGAGAATLAAYTL